MRDHHAVSQPCGTVLSHQPPNLCQLLLLAAPACQLANYIPLAYNLVHVPCLGANLAAVKGVCGEAEGPTYEICRPFVRPTS
jgi:hypothetical protein